MSHEHYIIQRLKTKTDYCAGIRQAVSELVHKYQERDEVRKKYQREHRSAQLQAYLEYSSLYRSTNWQRVLWKNMYQRTSPTSRNAKNYYHRGIRVCEEWCGEAGFLNFKAYIDEHLGPKPSKQHSLDRIRNDGNYEPGNIRWADQHTQQSNRRSSELSSAMRQIAVKLQSHGLTRVQIGSLLGISQSTVYRHLQPTAAEPVAA
jgi:hypothetical protein